MNKKVTRSVLVLAGTAITGMAYCPKPKPRPTRDFVETTYIRKTVTERLQASEERKRIIQDIKNIRKEIRNKALVYQKDNTRLTAITAMGKSQVNCTRLLDKLFGNALK
jgi:hypothetical protein